MQDNSSILRIFYDRAFITAPPPPPPPLITTTEVTVTTEEPSKFDLKLFYVELCLFA